MCCFSKKGEEIKILEKKQTYFTLQNSVPPLTLSNPTPLTFSGSQTTCKLPGYHSPCFILAYTFVSHQNHLQCLPFRIALLLTDPFKAQINVCSQVSLSPPLPRLGPLGIKNHTVQMVCSSLLLPEHILCQGTECQFSGENLLWRKIAA